MERDHCGHWARPPAQPHPSKPPSNIPQGGVMIILPEGGSERIGCLSQREGKLEMRAHTPSNTCQQMCQVRAPFCPLAHTAMIHAASLSILPCFYHPSAHPSAHLPTIRPCTHLPIHCPPTPPPPALLSTRATRSPPLSWEPVSRRAGQYRQKSSKTTRTRLVGLWQRSTVTHPRGPDPHGLVREGFPVGVCQSPILEDE